MLRKYKYHFAILLAALSYVSLPVFSVLLTQRHIDAFNQVLWRIIFSSIISFIIAKFFLKQRLLLNNNELGHLLVNAIIFLFGFTTFSGSIYLGTPIAKAIALTYSYPIPVTVLSYLLFKDFPRKKNLGAVVLSMVSVFVLLEIWSIKSLSEIHLGDFLAWSNSFFYGAIIVWGTKLGKDTTLNPFMSLFYTLLFTLPALFLFGTILTVFGFDLFTPSVNIPKGFDVWLTLTGLGLLGTVLPLALIYFGASGLKSYITSILLLTEPVWVYVFGLVLFHQSLSIWGILGIIGIIISLLLL